MRSSPGAPHSTEWCKVTNISARTQIFSLFSCIFECFGKKTAGRHAGGTKKGGFLLTRVAVVYMLALWQLLF